MIDEYVFDSEYSDLRYKVWLDKNVVEIEGGSYKVMKYQTTSTDSLCPINTDVRCGGNFLYCQM